MKNHNMRMGRELMSDSSSGSQGNNHQLSNIFTESVQCSIKNSRSFGLGIKAAENDTKEEGKGIFLCSFTAIILTILNKKRSI